MFRARCPARHTWELSPLYWPSLRVRTQYRVFLGFTHSLELLLLLNSPRKLRHHGKGGEEAGTRREGFFASLHFNSGRKNRKILSFLAFRPEGPHLCISYLRSKRREGRKGLRRRGCGCCQGRVKNQHCLTRVHPGQPSAGENGRFLFGRLEKMPQGDSHLPCLIDWPVFPDKIPPSGSQRSGA